MYIYTYISICMHSGAQGSLYQSIHSQIYVTFINIRIYICTYQCVCIQVHKVARFRALVEGLAVVVGGREDLGSSVATHCNTLQHTATHCNMPQHAATHCNTLQHTATHCNTQHHTATHCNTLQHIATHCNTLQHTVTHCTTLHHTASHCNTLQHTTKH